MKTALILGLLFLPLAAGLAAETTNPAPARSQL